METLQNKKKRVTRCRSEENPSYRREIGALSSLETTVSSLNVGLGWATAVATLETRFRPMSAPSKEPGICVFSTVAAAPGNASPPSVLPSKLPRRLSRGLGVLEYALWKSVSESSVVPVNAGVRAGVVGWSVVAVAASETEESSSSLSFFLAIVVTVVVVVLGGGGGGLTSLDTFLTAEGLFSARVGVLASSWCLAEELLRVPIESRRVVAVRMDVTVSPRFLEPLGTLPTPEALRERGRDTDTIVRPSVPSLSLSGLDWAFHCLSRSAASAFSN